MELDNAGFFIKTRERPCIGVSGTIGNYGCSGVGYYFSPVVETPKPSNCPRCGAPMMSYQTDCEYCGKNLKEKLCKNM